MPLYAYFCTGSCGEISSPVRADRITCDYCAMPAKRRVRVNVDRTSLKPTGGWNPVVGRYVANEAEFYSALAEGTERESKRLGMDVKLETVDARDNEGVAELHGYTPTQRSEDMEPTRRAGEKVALK